MKNGKKVKYNQTIKTKGRIFKMIRQFVNIAVAVMLVGGILFGIGKDSLATSNQKGIKESGAVTPQSIASKTKTTTIQVGQTVQTLYVTGTFETQYSDVHKRQLFSGVKSISSKASGSGTWTQTGYSVELIDSGRTYVITVSGKYSYNGATYTISTSIEFYCNANRSIG
ncbi:hypothetical protein [Anoxybacillus flavithermus]|uniref:hypothetical protein n=1 Tax=Anoxybacillus flavithermus TaxID=33934 RepID=UPI0007D9B10C|nr:hypothetical protein [Anoxybacillus flavithermus]MBE2904953.1 hypothetical protein [Anoxybacillus flavithermus]MBE2908159.1 hypothetical protein [Anoxybacillus flavithermus]MBE2911124.1 hypothetical protein [Anoxybacillus flavithermus]MBE2912009.1 hypothetical protein [Anoxybacillus flavithermus]MBE2916408.1 hypothetical protein [Anoxybacillus flavithermus]